MNTETPDDLMNLADAAKEFGEDKRGALGVKYATLRQWAIRGPKNGGIRSWRIGERIFVSRADVEQALRPKPGY